MSLGLQATKRRISSVNNTKKITNAMKLVATSKLRIWKNKLGGTSVYASTLHHLMGVLSLCVGKENLKAVYPYDETVDSTLYIIITSSLGLCGGYNYGVYKLAQKQIDKSKNKVVVIGTKGYSYFNKNKYNVDDKFVNLLNDYDLQKVRELRNYVMSLLDNRKVSKVRIIYTSFINSITFIPKCEDVFPLTNIDGEEPTQKEKDMLIEPNPEIVLKNIIPLYIESLINGRIIESSVSEQASRSNAMDSATDNAKDILSKLQIQYNKARQQAITQEITEIVGGANAQE